MCCCEKPTINGEHGYKWQPKDEPSVREPHPPTLRNGDTLLYDEPGRCGGLDSHCHHYRIVLSRSSAMDLLVRHGGGEERISLCTKSTLLSNLECMSSTARYWVANAVYHAYRDGKKSGLEESDSRWRLAAAERRIKVRKIRGSNLVKVSITPNNN